MALKVGSQLRIIPITAAYAVTNFDDVIQIDASANAVPVTIPDANQVPGKPITYTRTDTVAANAVTLIGIQTINGLTNMVLQPGDSITLASIGGVWLSIGLGLKSAQVAASAARNLIINGNFDFWQRNTTFSTAGYSADRWYFAIVGTVTCAQLTTGLLTGSRFGLKWTTGAGSSYAQIQHTIESSNVIPLRGRVMTLSGWAKSATGNFVGNMNMVMFYSNSTDARGSQSTFISQATATLTTSWQKFTLTFIVPADAFGIQIMWNPTSSQATGVEVDLSQMMLNEGAVAAPFALAGGDIQGEHAKCQRYFETGISVGWHGYVATAANYTANGVFIVEKRISPALTYLSDVAQAFFPTGAAAVYIQGSTKNFTAYKGSNGTGEARWLCLFAADAEL